MSDTITDDEVLALLTEEERAFWVLPPPTDDAGAKYEPYASFLRTIATERKMRREAEDAMHGGQLLVDRLREALDAMTKRAEALADIAKQTKADLVEERALADRLAADIEQRLEGTMPYKTSGALAEHAARRRG